MTLQISYRCFFAGWLVLLGTLLGACSANEDIPMSGDTQRQEAAQNISSDTSLYNAEDTAAVEQLLQSMTLQQKVAQMIQGEIKHVTPDDMRTYGLGSVLNGGGSFPNNEKYASIQAWVDLADAYYHASREVSAANAGIPTIWGTDAVHGHNNVVSTQHWARRC